MHVILYGVIAVGSMAIAIVVYTSVMLGWCYYCSRLPLPSRTIAAAASASRAEGEKSLSFQSPYIASSFRYKKEILENAEANSQPAGDECAVCLTAFSDGEIICQLPRCRHSFHSSCIDMWLFSHSDCPLCRASVDRVDSQRRSNATEENSTEVFLDIRSLS